MNRIREIREAAGLTSDELAELVGTSGAQIRRLETGARELTVGWMQKISEALKVTPADLIATSAIAEITDELELVEPDAVSRAIAGRGLKVYRVLARSVINTGIKPGDIIAVDETRAALDALKGLDVVVAEVGPDRNKVLRQFVPPDILIHEPRRLDARLVP